MQFNACFQFLVNKNESQTAGETVWILLSWQPTDLEPHCFSKLIDLDSARKMFDFF